MLIPDAALIKISLILQIQYDQFGDLLFIKSLFTV